jgi:hypothetical protein
MMENFLKNWRTTVTNSNSYKTKPNISTSRSTEVYAEDKISRSRNVSLCRKRKSVITDTLPGDRIWVQVIFHILYWTEAFFVELVIVYSCVASLYKPIRSDVIAVPTKGEEYLNIRVVYVRRVGDEEREMRNILKIAYRQICILLSL